MKQKRKVELNVFLFLVMVNGITGKDLVKFTNCPGDRILTFTPSETINIKPVWIGKNQSLLLNYEFRYVIYLTYENDMSNPPSYNTDSWFELGYQLAIPKYSLVPNLYNITVTRGGYERVVPANRDIHVTGEESFDRNFGKFHREDLKFEWSCTQKTQPGTFCSERIYTPKFTIRKNHARDGEIFNVTLKVTLGYLEEHTFKKESQTIIVKANAAELEIRKNCLSYTPFANYESSTLIGVSCVYNCDGIEDNDYVWNVKREDEASFAFDFKKSRYGMRGTKFLIEKNALDPNWYIIEVRTNSTRGACGYASLKISYNSPPDIRNCKITPPEGISHKTFFTVSCTQVPPNEPFFYQVFSRSSADPTLETTVTSGFYPDIEETFFTLPPSNGHDFIVRVTRIENEPHPVKEVQAYANVTSFAAHFDPNDTAKIFNDLYQGVNMTKPLSDMVASNNSDERASARQTFQNMVDDLVVAKIDNKDMSDFVESLKYSVAEDMLKAPIESIHELLEVSNTLTKLQQINVARESDPRLTKFTTTVCKKMANRSLAMLKNDQYPQMMEAAVLKLSKTLTSCFETNLSPNYNATKPIVVHVITQSPIIDGSVVSENYANYIDFEEKYYENLQDLKEAILNVVTGSSMTAKSLAMTTAIGEGIIRVHGKNSETLVLKDLGSEMTKITVESEGLKLINSRDLENDKRPYDLLMTMWKHDIFWWNPNRVDVYTNIVNVQFWHSTCEQRIESFKEPVDIFLDLKKDVNFEWEILSGLINLPEGYASMSDDDLNYEIKVYRVLLLQNQMLHVKFHNLTPSDIFDVVITNYKYPTVEDFQNKIIVKVGINYSLTLRNENDVQIHAYIGILVDKEVEQGQKTFTYGFSIYQKFCVKWIPYDNYWETTCVPGSDINESVIHCRCTRFSIIAGYIENVVLFPQEVLRPEIELKLTKSLVIFITTATTIAIILFLTLFDLKRKKEKLYFLADNNAFHRFVYLVGIKTGLGSNSGTSSNIIIKITGDKNTSEPHVLNYPDPKSRILQKFGNDMFIITTEHHLGNITLLELWFDCSGQNAAWYCRDIIILDLQKRTEWYFLVKKRMSLIKGSARLTLKPTHGEKKEVNVGVEPSPRKNVFKRFSKSKIISTPRYHNWYLWDHEPTFAYIKKLTVILSNMLTNYALVLTFIGQPSLQLNDGLDERWYYIINLNDLYVAVFTSFTTFMFHIAIAWCFRFSPKQFSRNKQNVKLTFRYTQACWCILLTMIITTTVYLIIFGFWVPYLKSLNWLTICIIGTFLGIMVYESIFFFIVNFFHRFHIKYDVDQKIIDIRNAIHSQRVYLFSRFGNLLLRPYFEKLYRPLNKKEIRGKTALVLKRQYFATELLDLVMFATYVVILYGAIMVSKDNLVVRSNTEMRELMRGEHTRTMNFHEIETAFDVYTYINRTLIPLIHPLRWYGNFALSEPALMTDAVNKFIGVVRFRQHRIMRNLCEAPELMRFLNLSCWPEFSLHHAETGTFGYKWGNFTKYMVFDRLVNVWRYYHEDETKTLFTVGQFAEYSGGGYIAYMGRTLYNSYANFQYLVDKVWIDEPTRVIFIEFLTYNSNFNVFNSVRLVFEHSAAGLVNGAVNVNTARLLSVNNETEIRGIVFFQLFFLWILILWVKQCLAIFKHFRTFYKNIWFLLDLTILFLSIFIVALFFVRVGLVRSYLKKLESAKNNQSVTYFLLFYIEDFFTLAASFLVSASTVRLWKFLRFARMFRMMERTLAIATPSFFSFSILFTVMVAAFAMTILLLVGNQFERVHSPVKIFRLMTTMALKPKEMELDKYVVFKVALLYLVAYTVTLIMSLFIFIMITLMSYIKAQWEFSTQADTYTVRNYIKERTKYLFKFCRYKTKRLKGGVMTLTDDSTVKVEPKSHKFMYFNSFSLSSPRMLIMKYMTQCILRQKERKKSVLSEFDRKMMTLIARLFFTKDKGIHREVFFKGRDDEEQVHLVDEKRIDKVANIVNLLLQEGLTFSEVDDEERNAVYFEYVREIKKKLYAVKRCELRMRGILIATRATEKKLAKIT